MNKDFIQRIKRFLISPVTGISLIVLILVFCLLGLIIPQLSEKNPEYFEILKDRNPVIYALVDFLQINHIYTSVLFFSLVALATASLTYNVFIMIRRLLRARLLKDRKVDEDSFKDFYSFKIGQKDCQSKIEQFFKKKNGIDFIIKVRMVKAIIFLENTKLVSGGS